MLLRLCCRCVVVVGFVVDVLVVIGFGVDVDDVVVVVIVVV